VTTMTTRTSRSEAASAAALALMIYREEGASFLRRLHSSSAKVVERHYSFLPRAPPPPVMLGRIDRGLTPQVIQRPGR
jgi:hypothetical protein